MRLRKNEFRKRSGSYLIAVFRPCAQSASRSCTLLGIMQQNLQVSRWRHAFFTQVLPKLTHQKRNDDSAISCLAVSNVHRLQ